MQAAGSTNSINNGYIINYIIQTASKCFPDMKLFGGTNAV